MTRLLLIFTSAEAGALLAITNRLPLLAAYIIIAGSQAAVRYDSGWNHGRDHEATRR